MTMDGHIEVCESLLTDFPNLNGFYNSFTNFTDFTKIIDKC